MKRRRFIKVSLLSSIAAATLPRILLRAAPLPPGNLPAAAIQDHLMPLFATGDQLAGAGLDNFNDASFEEMSADILAHRMPTDWGGDPNALDADGGEWT